MANVNSKATKYIEKLNEEKGWNLIGGHRSKEFSIRSGRTAAGRFYFDGFDKDRMIIFEYDELAHENPEVKENDKEKEERLSEVLKSYKTTATLIRYSEKYNTLTEKKI